jgi:metallopeptidase MepB
LKHFDVVQLFHELGHAIHDLLSHTRYARFHGPSNVSVDFGEIPSQVLEHWCWQTGVLRRLSCHYSYLPDDVRKEWKDKGAKAAEEITNWETNGEQGQRPPKELPDEMIKSLLKSRYTTFGAVFHLKQVHKAAFDLTIHHAKCHEEIMQLDLAVQWTSSMKRICPLDGPWEVSGQDENQITLLHGYAHFEHFMGDYDAGYYAYL